MIKNNRKAFTIIEVVLVLAIAGLIFLMVFIALPALQRGQRNTRRRQDMARILSAVTEYQTNNNGKSPSTYAGWHSANKISEDNVDPGFVKRFIDSTCDEGTHDNSLAGNTSQSITYKYNCSGDQFKDPDGANYSLTFGNAQPLLYLDNKGDGGAWMSTETMRRDHLVYLATNSICSGNEAQPLARSSGGASDVAIVYALEGGAIYCGDNQ